MIYIQAQCYLDGSRIYKGLGRAIGLSGLLFCTLTVIESRSQRYPRSGGDSSPGQRERGIHEGRLGENEAEPVVEGARDSMLRASCEMSFQWDRAYRVDSGRFAQRFWSDATLFEVGAPAAALSFKGA
jgi:hypothetical protein